MSEPRTSFNTPIYGGTIPRRGRNYKHGEADKRKQSLYFPEEMLIEIQNEADRQDRSMSWIVQQAWKIARGEISRFPSVDDVLGGR